MTTQMKALIIETLSELTKASVRENTKPGVMCNLFYDENAPQIDFNGFKCPSDYENHCNSLFDTIKIKIEMTNSTPEEKTLHLKELKFEVADFKKRLFPEDDLIFIFERIKPVKAKSLSNYPPETLKKKILVFLNIQLRLLGRIEDFFNYTIRKINSKPIQYFKSIPPLFPEAFDRNRILSKGFNQLRVFNKDTGATYLSFNGSKSDFEVFIDLIQRAKIFIHPNGKTATKPELRELFSFIGNFESAKNPASTLNEAKERAEKSEHIFTRLTAAYQEFKQDVFHHKVKKTGM